MLNNGECYMDLAFETLSSSPYKLIFSDFIIVLVLVLHSQSWSFIISGLPCCNRLDISKRASAICPDKCHLYSAWGAPFPLIQLGLGWRSPSLVKAVGGVWWGNYQ